MKQLRERYSSWCQYQKLKMSLIGFLHWVHILSSLSPSCLSLLFLLPFHPPNLMPDVPLGNMRALTLDLTSGSKTWTRIRLYRGLLKTQMAALPPLDFPFQQAWNGAWEFASLINSQAMMGLWVQRGPTGSEMVARNPASANSHANFWSLFVFASHWDALRK